MYYKQSRNDEEPPCQLVLSEASCLNQIWLYIVLTFSKCVHCSGTRVNLNIGHLLVVVVMCLYLTSHQKLRSYGDGPWLLKSHPTDWGNWVSNL